MGTTQAFRTALHIPFADPVVNQVVSTETPGDAYQTKWVNAAAGSAFPTPDAANLVLLSGPGPGYAWTLTTLDAGTF